MDIAAGMVPAWAGLIALAVGLWPRRPFLAAASWLGTFALVAVFLWDDAGLLAAVLATATLIHTVRATDAAASNRDLSRAGYLFYVLFPLLVPARDQVDPPPRSRCWLLVPRGAALVTLAAGLVFLGYVVEPWRTHPYLDDLWIALELGVFFTGLVDLIYASAIFLRLRVPRPHDPLFFAATSLREFWGSRWNTMFGRSLRRAALPVFGRRQFVAGALAAFVLSALVHTLPALVIHPSGRYCAFLMLTAFLFFALHGVAVILERWFAKRSGRKSNRAWLLIVWALTIPLFPGPGGPALGHHNRPASDVTLFHVVPELGEMTGEAG